MNAITRIPTDDAQPIAGEEWRKIPGFDERYTVSNMGRVRGATGRILKLKTDPRGYVFFCIANGRGGATNMSVARAVCAAFNGLPNFPSAHCDHINRARGDNRPENLRWVTREENLENRTRKRGESNHMAKLKSHMVDEIKATPHRRGLDAEFAKRFGVARETVRDIRRGIKWEHRNA